MRLEIVLEWCSAISLRVKFGIRLEIILDGNYNNVKIKLGIGSQNGVGFKGQV